MLKEVQSIFKDPKRSKTKLKKSLDVGKRFSKGRISWDAQDDTLIVLEQILECINNVFPEKEVYIHGLKNLPKRIQLSMSKM